MSGIISKLFALVRGKSHEAGQAVVDTNAITILDQEIRDTSTALNRSREELTKLMAQSKIQGNKIADRQAKIEQYNGYVQGALSKGDESLAREVAEKLAPLEAEQAAEISAKSALDRSVATLKSTITKTEGQLRGLRTQVDTVKATASVQKAQLAIANRAAGANSGMVNALDSLKRIQDRQAETSARIEAGEELESSKDEGDLNKKLAAAGLLEDNSSADAILSRFKKPAQLGHDQVQVIHAQVIPEAQTVARPE